jgi:hypothetical protein
MLITAIDPGTEQSAVVRWNGSLVKMAEILPNADVLVYLDNISWSAGPLVIEWIESFGMPVGREVFETCRWVGRFHQQYPGQTHYVTRKEVKLNLCGSTKAKDANIRQALIDRFGLPGTKRQPGATYGLKKDLWSAFAVAVTWMDARKMEAKP